MATHIEEPIDRAGFVYPWMLVIQDNDEGPGYVWGVASQSSTAWRWRGTADSIDEARKDAHKAVCDE